MKSDRKVKISKFLSYHLRHHPEKLSLTLEPGGWVAIELLLKACAEHKFSLSLGELKEVVLTNDKKRFSFDQTETKIRANQGHSVKIDLQLTPLKPPDLLFHGTNTKDLSSILSQGLQKMSRHHVHLSIDTDTAQKVGQRRGKPIVLKINAAQMFEDGFIFYCSDNGVWLVDQVPPQYFC